MLSLLPHKYMAVIHLICLCPLCNGVQALLLLQHSVYWFH